MSLTVEQLFELRKALMRLDATERRSALEALGAPTPQQLAEDAEPFLHSPDRNVRVAALRVLAFADGPAAIEGVLLGLDDPMKRVREVAARSSARFVEDVRVERLQAAVRDDESGSCAPAASILAGMYHAPYGIMAIEPVGDALRWMREQPQHRQFALVALLRTRSLTDDTTALLRDIVATGSKDEAVAATRRLCGFRVAHHGELDAAARRTADRAWGDVYFWVRVPDER